MIEWHEYFKAADILLLILATVATTLLVGPGLVLLTASLSRRRLSQLRGDAAVAFVAILSLAWGLWIYSIAFGPSWGTRPNVEPTAAPAVLTDLRTLMHQEEAVEDTTARQGTGGLFGALDLAGFRELAPNQGQQGPMYPTRRPHHQFPHVLFMLLQLALFLAFSVPLLILLDRWKAAGLFAFILLWGTLVYAPVAHWCWGAGWLSRRGTLDTAGGLIFLCIGVAALSLAPFLNRRTEEETPPDTASRPGLPGIGAGATLIWGGLLIVNAALTWSPDGRAAMALFNTHLAAATGVIAAALTAKLLGNDHVPACACMGAVGGLTAIAPASGLVLPQPALIIGAVGGLTACLLQHVLAARERQKEGLALFALLGAPAALGTTLTGIFATSNVAGFDLQRRPIEGLVGGNVDRLWAQLLAVAAVAGWSCAGTLLTFFAARLLAGSPTASNADSSTDPAV